MRWAAVCLAWIALLPLGSLVCAQLQPPSEKFEINAGSAFNWSDSDNQIVQFDGGVTITLDRATLHADQGVLWLTPVSGGAPGEQRAEFELIGHVEVRQPGILRTSAHLWIVTEVLNDPHIVANPREARDMSGSALFKTASDWRHAAATQPALNNNPLPATNPAHPTTRIARPASQPAEAGFAVQLEGNIEVADSEEGNVAFVVTGGVTVRVETNGDTIEMQAQRAVLFTAVQSLRDMSQQAKTEQGMRRVTAVYLEGDARIQFDAVKLAGIEERLQAERVYYELATDRAILVNAVMHTTIPKPQIPVILRAKILRQLSKTEYSMKGVELTSSSFAVPSYSIQTDRMNVQTEATGDPEFPERVNYQGNNVTFRTFDVPFFYLPSVAGTMGDRPGMMRQIGFSHRDDWGYSLLSDWGLFETLGHLPPKSLDAAYRIDYFGSRGPAGGIDATYGAASATETDHQPLNFNGDLRSYFVYDRGIDADYGRVPVDPGGPGSNLRGRLLFEHTHYLPDDWEAQVRLGYVSDPTFLEEWFPLQFMQEGPTDETLYLKHQRDSEAFTMLVEAQPNQLITTSDRMAEQFEVERYPDLGYHREGDSLGDNTLTFFSDNSGAGLAFQPTRATLAQQGFRTPDILPGIPALGQTGITKAITWRGDFREEVDWPVSMDHFKVVPYLVGRLTEYSNSPSGSDQSRVFGGAGARISTTFWRVDPSAESDLLDIHQLRHVVEPTLDLFASGSTVDRGQLYMYDTAVDAINDISGLDVGLHQRWQTQRGGPGQWRSVDVLTVDLDLALFANKPNTFGFRNPTDFRGMFFSTDPETSIPRDAINANATWRLTDNTVILADAQYNLDAEKLATGALGVLVRRDVQESFYLGDRYIADLNSNIVTIEVDYTISPKYAFEIGQNFDLGLNKDVSSNIAIIRYFDRFVMIFSAGHDQIANQTTFSVGLMPLGFGQALSSSTLQGPFQR